MAISLDDVPQELVLEIISWLPAKAVHKFKYANHDIFSLYSATTEFHHFSSVEKSSSGVSPDFLDFLTNYPSCRILASSNGLILGRSTKYNNEIELFISNPATKSWLSIPTPDYLKENPNFDINIAFECNNQDSHSDDYTMFHFEAPDEWSSSCYGVEFYSPKEGIWKGTEKGFFIGVDYEASKWKRVLKIRVKAILGIKEEESVIVRGFKVMNGDYLVFATQKKVYGYGLGCKNYMKLQEICEHQFDHGGDKVSFTSYSDTLRSCGDGVTTLPLMQQPY
ncbi:F-box protein [Senna tora]|uniref:F-box protein n=1 Tax=Senna tora TaxID=362788 RepID=A0A834WRS5_9FABA|nr:F-box protein [Senna tora]